MHVSYDGSFEGFLTIVYEYFYKKLPLKEISKVSAVTLFSECEIKTDTQKAQKVFQALEKNFSKQNLIAIRDVFLCDSENFENALFSFIILGFKDKKNLNNINISYVYFVKNLEKEYRQLIHKMEGFTRFEELEDNTLYAKIDTKFNIIYELGKHFANRLHNHSFIIHDVKRELAFVYKEKQMDILHVNSFENPKYSKNEEMFQKLWKVFLKNVSIKTRENKKLQQQLAPLIYRTYMSEFNKNFTR